MDIGTGGTGVLALTAKHAFPDSNVFGLDKLRENVSGAVRTAARNELEVAFYVGDLLTGNMAKFDVIVFNAPYIDDDTNQRLGMLPDPISRKTCHGGSDGCETIKRLLSSITNHLKPDGLLLLGVNGFYVPLGRLRNLLSDFSCKEVSVIENRITLSYVIAING